jgi:hypothetical protein
MFVKVTRGYEAMRARTDDKGGKRGKGGKGSKGGKGGKGGLPRRVA